MNRIDEVFSALRQSGRKGFIPYITAGYPDLASTEALVREFDRLGAAAVELGVPFSDPVADGAVIQTSSQAALKGGTTLRKVLSLVQGLRRDCQVPIVLFSYFNPIHRLGADHFAELAVESGVDGALVLDLSFEEGKTYWSRPAFKKIKPIFLVAPTTAPDRLGAICRAAGGFVYVISRLGVTGTDATTGDARSLVQEIRRHTRVPVALGFGVSTREHVREAASYADAVVVGSAIVKALGEGLPEGAPAAVRRAVALVEDLMGGLA